MPPLPSHRSASLVRMTMADMAELADQRPGAIRLENADAYLPPPAEAIQATREAVGVDRYNSYLPLHGLPELRQAIAARIVADLGLHYDPEGEVLVTCGAPCQRAGQDGAGADQFNYSCDLRVTAIHKRFHNVCAIVPDNPLDPLLTHRFLLSKPPMARQRELLMLSSASRPVRLEPGARSVDRLLLQPHRRKLMVSAFQPLNSCAVGGIGFAI